MTTGASWPTIRSLSPRPPPLPPTLHRRTNPMPFITAKDGAELYWREWGAGAPILFLSSLGCDSRMWDYQIAAFADEGFRCIGFDRRGHGRSDQPARGYDFDTFADDVATLVEQPRSHRPHPHRPFDGGRRGGAVSHPAREPTRRAPRPPRADDADAAQDATTTRTACRWKPSRRCGLGGVATTRNGSTTTSRRSSFRRPRPR